MKCPKCNHDFVEVRTEGVMIDVCKFCGGVYLDNGELEKMLGDKAYYNTSYNHLSEKYRKKQEFQKKHPILYMIKEILD